jgi:hypothetical protein
MCNKKLCCCWPCAVLPHAGSGKTLAYLLPAFSHLSTSSSSSSNTQQQPGDDQVVQPRVLVLLPSRELAQQVHAQCTALFSVTGISAAVVYGGVPKEAQVGGVQRLHVHVQSKSTSSCSSTMSEFEWMVPTCAASCVGGVATMFTTA